MSIFGKVKELLGIVALKMKIDAKPVFMVEDKTIEGKLHLLTRRDEQLTSIEIRFEEFYSAGRGSSKSSATMRLGGVFLAPRYIIGGDPVELDFDFPFTYGKSKNDNRIDKGGLIGTVGKIGKFVHNEKSKFKLVAIVKLNRHEEEIVEEFPIKRVRVTEIK